jgi:hypothetical protein
MSKQPEVFLPPKYEIADIDAIQAVMSGVANEQQQQRAMTWIIYNACGTYELEYRTEARDHAFASGRRFVGLQIVKMLKLNKAAFKGQA